MSRFHPVILTVFALIGFVHFCGAQCSDGSRLSCSNCSSVSVCSYTGVQVNEYRCETADATRPFCSGNTGQCTSQPEGDCIQPSELCPRELDTFPQPSNCLKYVYCDEQKNAYELSCSPTNYVYDHSIRSCRYRRVAADCFQVNCARNVNRWISYQPAPRLAIFCSDAVGPMTFECDGESDVFDIHSRNCVFSCPTEGQFPVPGNPTRYYLCYRGAYNRLVLVEQSCPPGFTFNPSVSRCTIPPSTTTTTTSTEATIPTEQPSTQSQETTDNQSSTQTEPTATNAPDESTPTEVTSDNPTTEEEVTTSGTTSEAPGGSTASEGTSESPSGTSTEREPTATDVAGESSTTEVTSDNPSIAPTENESTSTDASGGSTPETFDSSSEASTGGPPTTNAPDESLTTQETSDSPSTTVSDTSDSPSTATDASGESSATSDNPSIAPTEEESTSTDGSTTTEESSDSPSTDLSELASTGDPDETTQETLESSSTLAEG